MHCVKLLGQRLMARDFDRQDAEVQVRIAVLNGYTALGIPVSKAVGCIRLGKGENRPSADLRNRATCLVLFSVLEWIEVAHRLHHVIGSQVAWHLFE
jgi:hypothetical protein